ncbi:MAG: L,D-transpeptidase [Pyrinomonadaceae bacterium]
MKLILPPARITALIFMLFVTFSFSFAQNIADRNRSIPNKSAMKEQAAKLLSEMGYWIPKTGPKTDNNLFYAVTAFQKVEGRKRTGILNKNELEAIKNASRPAPIFIGEKHVEVDLNRQVLFLVDENDRVTFILPVSSGNDKVYYDDGKKAVAHTPRGIFKITRQIKGVRKAPLGILYHPNYFLRGFAIHGSDSIPFYPASHGCVRIPRYSAALFSDMVAVGLIVIIHEYDGKRQLPIDGLDDKKTAGSESSGGVPCTTG